MSKVIRVLLWFCFTSLCDWLKNLAPLSRPIRSKTQTNRDLLARVFPRLAPVTCICFEFWLVHWVICLLWLAGVITLVLVLRHSFENRSCTLKLLTNVLPRQLFKLFRQVFKLSILMAVVCFLFTNLRLYLRLDVKRLCCAWVKLPSTNFWVVWTRNPQNFCDVAPLKLGVKICDSGNSTQRARKYEIG